MTRVYAWCTENPLSEYLPPSDEEITRRLDKGYETEPSSVDPAFVAAQARSIPPENW